jgi:hypothetical protein
MSLAAKSLASPLLVTSNVSRSSILPFLSSLSVAYSAQKPFVSAIRFIYLTNVCNFPELRHDRLLETPAVTCYASSPRAPPLIIAAGSRLYMSFVQTAVSLHNF